MNDWTRICSVKELGDRFHGKVRDRYVSVIKHLEKLYCIDSVCFHMGGPLTAGDIEEIKGNSCLICPWHKLKVCLEDGRTISNVRQTRIVTAIQPDTCTYFQLFREYCPLHPLVNHR